MNSSSTEYRIWAGMRQRCSNPHNESYHRYGGRGITVCERWLGKDGFKNFVTDMGARPSTRYSLDRINNDGNYEPDNCRWATRHQQAANRSDVSDHIGVSYYKKLDMWIAHLRYDGKIVLRKYFKTFDEAIEARHQAEIKYFKE